MSPTQIERLISDHGPMMRRLGYFVVEQRNEHREDCRLPDADGVLVGAARVSQEVIAVESDAEIVVRDDRRTSIRLEIAGW